MHPAPCKAVPGFTQPHQRTTHIPGAAAAKAPLRCTHPLVLYKFVSIVTSKVLLPRSAGEILEEKLQPYLQQHALYQLCISVFSKAHGHLGSTVTVVGTSFNKSNCRTKVLTKKKKKKFCAAFGSAHAKTYFYAEFQ